MFCEKCGMQLEEGMVFCPGCGNKIVNTEEAENGVEDNEDIAANEDIVVSVSEDEKTIIYERTPDEEEKVEAQSVAVSNAPVQNAIAPGTIIETSKIKYCHNCGAANAESDAFCYSCGTPFEQEEKDIGKKINFKKKISKKAMAGIAAGCVAIIAVVCLVLFGGKSENKEQLLYLKDNELVSLQKNEKLVLDDDIYEDWDSVYGPYSGLSLYVTISEDGKYVFYPQDYEGGSFNLYYRKLGDANAESNKIASDVAGYTVLKDNKVVYKESGSTGRLYISDLTDKEKIASDVSWYKISQDEKNILWQTSDGENRLYSCDLALEGEKNKLDSDVSYLVYISDDLKKIAYRKDDALYYIENLGEKTKIDSDIAECYWVKSGEQVEIYYFVEGDEEYKLSDIIEDDYAEQDAAIREPNIVDYQKIETKPSFWGMREETVTDDSYYDDLSKYNEKLERDMFRDSIDQELIDNEYTVYRYILGDEDSEKYASGAIAGISGYGEPVFLYFECDLESIEKVKMSKIIEMDYYEIIKRISKSMLEVAKIYLVNNGQKVELDIDFSEYEDEFIEDTIESLYVRAVNEKAKECYLAVETYDDQGEIHTELFKTNYEKMDGKMELVVEEAGNIELETDRGVYYTTELKDGVGELYLNDHKVNSDVQSGSLMELGNGEGILYLTDPNDKKREGTLRMYNGSESIKIADDVAFYQSNDKGEIAFLVDYNFNRYRGDLKLYKDNKVTPVDSDVTCILYY